MIHPFPTSTPVLLSTPVTPPPHAQSGSVCEELCDLRLGHYRLSSHEKSLTKLSHSVLLYKNMFPFCLFLTILRLPPGLEAIGGEGGDHVLNRMADGVVVLIVHLPGVT